MIYCNFKFKCYWDYITAISCKIYCIKIA